MGYWRTIYSLPLCQKGMKKSLTHWLKSLITAESKNSSHLSSLSLHLYCIGWIDGVFIVLTRLNFLSQVTCTELLSNPLSVSAVFFINVQDVNEAPYNLTISSQSVSENQETGYFVGMLSVLDPDLPVGNWCTRVYRTPFVRNFWVEARWYPKHLD